MKRGGKVHGPCFFTPQIRATRLLPPGTSQLDHPIPLFYGSFHDITWPSHSFRCSYISLQSRGRVSQLQTIPITDSPSPTSAIMSFITQVAARRMALSSRAAMVQAPRQFSTTIAAHKSATEAAKDTLKSVDRKVSDKLVDGINAGSKAAEKVTGEATEKGYKASGTASEVEGKMKGKTEELKGKAEKVAKDAEGKVKSNM
ncbi:hypothetical protein GGR56DRAFT_515136 [Xylariaceae sp. FL0804]|nr:hypothetical protein GGR56DRAFT_515136 [Xylariaceae sp. FL0804]